MIKRSWKSAAGQMCAKSARSRARSNQKCLRPGSALLRRIFRGCHGSKAASMFASSPCGDPRRWTEQRRCNTLFIKCACQICTLHTFWKAQDEEILQFVGVSVWHPDCGIGLPPENSAEIDPPRETSTTGS